VVLSTTKTYFDRHDRSVNNNNNNKNNKEDGTVPFLKASNKYPAKLRWQSPQTLAKKILGETQFASCEVHSVMMKDKSIVHDWIFMVKTNL
jgi:hypothetical protein